ncbi:MAG: Fe-S cluster assembly protein SufD [Prevotella sp.]|nr:Fe-S cluster assembly protein SufD [Prevotella sp.]
MNIDNIPNKSLTAPLPHREGQGESLQYIELYEQARQMIFGHSSDVMNAMRDEAFSDFKRLGFPTKKVERYKYTDIPALFAPDYGLNLNRFEIPVDPYEAFRCDVPNLSTLLYFVVNDAFYQKALPKVSLPEGVIIGSLRENTDIVKAYYGRLAKTADDGVTALNTMLAQDGLLVYVPKNVVVGKAVQVINILKSPTPVSQHSTPSFMANRRVLVIAEECAEVKLLFCDHTADDCNFLTTQVIEVFAGENSKVDLYCMEETHAKNVRISNVYVRQDRDSRVKHNVLTLHNGITRNKLDLILAGDGAECQCNGCVIADKQQHVDNNTLIVHEAQHCTSNELYKYVLDQHATGAFAGRVYVAHGAQKTVSQMTNQNLTTTREARMFTQPMLEIYADDVKCAHGSTVGQLNDAALFYMRQRGITEKEARMLLQVAFIREVIDMVELVPLRDRLHYLVEQRFRGKLSKCEGCKLCK